MATLVLNPTGEAKARTQYRCFEYLNLLVTAAGRPPESYALGPSNRDRYLGDCIQRTDILDLVLQAAGCTPKSSQNVPLEPDAPKMNLHLPETMGSTEAVLPEVDPAEAHRRYKTYCAEIEKVHTDPLHPAPALATTETYFKLIDNLFSTLLYIEKLPDTPNIDWNDDHFTLDYKPCPDEVKLVINLDSNALTALDNNKDLKDRANWCGNGVWYVLLLCFAIGFPLSMIQLTIPFYLTNLGANASQTSNAQTFFNLAQLFFCPLWLWVSEIIGRKPIYIQLFSGYLVTSILLLVTPYIFVRTTDQQVTANPQSQISYILGMRFLMGVFAYAIPLGFVTLSDLANPRARPIALIMANVMTQIGTGISSAIVAFAFSSGRYIGNVRDSFVHTFIFVAVLLTLGLVGTFFFKESSAGVIARKAAKKMGRTDSSTYKSEVKRDSFFVTFKNIVSNRELVLLWFAYVFQMLCGQMPIGTQSYLISKYYGFSDSQKAKRLNALSNIVVVLVSFCFTLGLTRFLARKIGELRIIIISIYFSMIPSLLRWAIDPPIPQWIMFLPFNTIATSLGDALFIQFATLYTTPKNRGTLLGIFQIGNSIGRFGGSLMGGELYNWSWRDGSILFLLFGFVSLAIICFIKPPLEQNTAKEVEERQREQARRMASV